MAGGIGYSEGVSTDFSNILKIGGKWRILILMTEKTKPR